MIWNNDSIYYHSAFISLISLIYVLQTYTYTSILHFVNSTTKIYKWYSWRRPVLKNFKRFKRCTQITDLYFKLMYRNNWYMDGMFIWNGSVGICIYIIYLWLVLLVCRRTIYHFTNPQMLNRQCFDWESDR